MPLTGADGLIGELRMGGRGCATVRDWSLRPGEGGTWVIRARLTEVNEAYLASGQPVEVRLAIGKRIWRWRHVAVERLGAGAVITTRAELYEQI